MQDLLQEVDLADLVEHLGGVVGVRDPAEDDLGLGDRRSVLLGDGCHHDEDAVGAEHPAVAQRDIRRVTDIHAVDEHDAALLACGEAGAAIFAVGLIATRGGWPVAATAPLLFVAGAGHACGFSPLANRLTVTVRPDQVGDLSGLLMTASLVGAVIGTAGFVGIYLGAEAHGSAHALARTTGVLAVALVVTAACAVRALSPRGVAAEATA